MDSLVFAVVLSFVWLGGMYLTVAMQDVKRVGNCQRQLFNL